MSAKWKNESGDNFMIIDDIKQCLKELRTHILFDYDGKQCGIDPISHSHFEMWCGDKDCTVNNIEGVMNEPFFMEIHY